MAARGTVLVTGATGNVGRQVVAQLRELGVTVRAGVRRPEVADLPDGVQVARVDLTDPASLDGALDGVDSVFLLWPFLSADGAAVAVDALARRARRIVYLSAMNVRDDRPPEQNGVWGLLEALIERSGVEWTFLRSGGLAVNALGWAGDIRADGVVRWPYGAAARSLIHERDIAAVAVCALVERDRHAGAKYVLTGPAAITQAEQVQVIGEEIGRELRWEDLPPEAARERLLGTLGDPGFVDGSLSYWASLVADPEPVTRTVAELTGAPAASFRRWARDHRDDFRVLPPAEVAHAYVTAFRRARLDDAFSLLSPDMVRVAPQESTGNGAELHGLDAIMDNSARLNADLEIHRVDVDGPFIEGDRFAVRFAFDETYVPTGKRETTSKVSLCTVADGMIRREEVFYHEAPRHSGDRRDLERPVTGLGGPAS